MTWAEEKARKMFPEDGWYETIWQDMRKLAENIIAETIEKCAEVAVEAEILEREVGDAIRKLATAEVQEPQAGSTHVIGGVPFDAGIVEVTPAPHEDTSAAFAAFSVDTVQQHPPPWKWVDGRLIDANGDRLVYPTTDEDAKCASTYVRAATELAPEMEAALRWFVKMAGTSPMHPKVAEAARLLAKLDEARKAGG